MGADNVINSQELRATAARRVWVVNTSDDSPWHCPVPVPPHWLAVRHVIFTDTYNIKTDIVVVEYDTTGTRLGNDYQAIDRRGEHFSRVGTADSSPGRESWASMTEVVKSRRDDRTMPRSRI